LPAEEQGDPLVRASARVLRGEKWNEREILETEYKVEEVRVGNQSFKVENWADFEFPSDVEMDKNDVMMCFIAAGKTKRRFVATKER
jgi:hypothetical protein